MTNFEKYKDDLAKMTVDSGIFAVVNGKPVYCSDTKCTDCDIYSNVDIACKARTKKWAESECEEPIKLNDQEQKFCEMIESGYIARDVSGSLYWYKAKPKKGVAVWLGESESLWLEKGNTSIRLIFEGKLDFAFIKWEDEEPWSIADILERCEVE